MRAVDADRGAQPANMALVNALVANQSWEAPLDGIHRMIAHLGRPPPPDALQLVDRVGKLRATGAATGR